MKAQSPNIMDNRLYRDIIKHQVISQGGSEDIFLSIPNQTHKRVAELSSSYLDNANNVEAYNAIKILQDMYEYPLLTQTSDTINKKYIDTSGVFYTYESTKELKEESRNYEREPVLKYFYKNPAHFLHFDNEDFKISIDPIVNMRYGQDGNNENILFQNTRGIKIRGLIDGKVYFFTSVYENQARFNNYVDVYVDKFRTLAGDGTYKGYTSTVIDDLTGYDYHNAQAYVGVPVSKHVNIEFGHGRHFIGNGHRSLLLSDFAQNYLYMRFNTQVWKFHYQNLFAEMNPITARLNPGDKILPKKYMASHYLAFKPHKRFEIGLFESVMFSREDHFEFNYLNPIILYRSVEQFLDSPDNVMIGLNISWIPLNGLQVYGQLLLDEFKLDELKAGNGWWANKYGIQAGAMLTNAFGIKNLDLTAEYNMVRPYTYTHNTGLSINDYYSTASYSHFNQSLAHPLGANFKEVLAKISYQPFNRLQLNLKTIMMEQGEDTTDEFYGANILIPNKYVLNQYGNELLQGVKSKTLIFEFNASYEFFRNYYFDFDFLYRKKDSDDNLRDLETQYIGGGIRINVDRNTFDF
jgi:hypothetical protein